MEELNNLINGLLDKCKDLRELSWNQYYDLYNNIIIDGVRVNEEVSEQTIEILSNFLNNVKKLENIFGNHVRVTVYKTTTFKIKVEEIVEFIN